LAVVDVVGWLSLWLFSSRSARVSASALALAFGSGLL